MSKFLDEAMNLGTFEREKEARKQEEARERLEKSYRDALLAALSILGAPDARANYYDQIRQVGSSPPRFEVEYDGLVVRNVYPYYANLIEIEDPGAYRTIQVNLLYGATPEQIRANWIKCIAKEWYSQ